MSFRLLVPKRGNKFDAKYLKRPDTGKGEVNLPNVYNCNKIWREIEGLLKNLLIMSPPFLHDAMSVNQEFDYIPKHHAAIKKVLKICEYETL